MYAQQIEGESWRGEKMDKGKIDKMSGRYTFVDLNNSVVVHFWRATWCGVSADRKFTDQQVGQLYELMIAIREKELSENDPEYEAPSRA